MQIFSGGSKIYPEINVGSFGAPPSFTETSGISNQNKRRLIQMVMKGSRSSQGSTVVSGYVINTDGSIARK
jgi:hypothetical protein